jgi:glucose/arabinose dehydrogenase
MRPILLALLLSFALPAAAAPHVSDAPPPAAPGLRVVSLVEGLANPWSLAFLPDGVVLVTERPGRLRVVRAGVLDPRPVAGVPEVFARGQGGLFDVLPHPDFARNRLLFLSHAAGDASANRLRVVRGVFDGAALRDVRVVFEVPQAKPGAQHFGGRLLVLPDGSLLVSVGDGGNPPASLDGRLIRENAQDMRSLLGKVVRVAAEGAQVWTLGHRNIQGLAWDAGRGVVWVSEHGSRFGDEVNLLRQGLNYGWPRATWSREYSGGEISPLRSAPGMEDPRLVWLAPHAPSGLAVVAGDRLPGWRGDVVSGGLQSRDVRRLRLDAAGELRGEERVPVGRRVRDVKEGPDGLLYLLTDEDQGALLRIEPSN